MCVLLVVTLYLVKQQACGVRVTGCSRWVGSIRVTGAMSFIGKV